MMHGSSFSLALFFLVSLATAVPGRAQNLLVNADFDTDLSGWTLTGSPAAEAWSSDDVAGEDDSGSAELGVLASDPGFVMSARLDQCVPVVGGAQYDLAAFIKEPAGQPVSGRALIDLRWFGDATCEGAEIGGSPGATPLEDLPGEWVLAQEEHVFSTAFAPEGAAGARVSLGVIRNELGQPGDVRTARFDDVRFCPVGTCATLGDEVMNLGTDPGADRFQFRVSFEGGDSASRGVQEPLCLAETACASGALPGRVEAQLRVIGPRPNGFLWLHVVRFTPSRIVVEAVRYPAGTVHYYVLPAVEPGERPTNLEDRTAFLP